MPGPDVFTLWAVHISDGAVAPLWAAGGFVVAGLLALFGAWRIRDEEIPRVAVLASAFFVASLVHVRVPPTSVHLLLNGLIGVVLGRRAALAIPVGLFLQAVLIGHGGLSALGVNSCVMVLPALAAWLLFAGLQRLPWLRHPWFRTAIVAVCSFVWVISLVGSFALLVSSRRHDLDFFWVNRVAFHPLILGWAALLAGLAAWAERSLENAPEFPLGLIIGEVSVLASVALTGLVLYWGGQESWRSLVVLLFLAHLPVAVAEGVIVGFTVGFLARVRPEMLGLERGTVVTVPVDEGPRLALNNGAPLVPPRERPRGLTETKECSVDPLS